MRHVSLAGPPPSAAEDLLVLGVQLSLLRAVGCRDATAWAGAAHVALPDGSWDSAAIDAAVAAGDTATWHLSWSGWAPVCGPPFAVTAGAPIGTPAVTFDGCTEAAALAALLARDPARHLALAEAVSTLGLSPRTLQRRLAAHGLTATAVGRAVQVRHACALLAGGGDPLPAIGFACGFSDQAHFTREFRKRVNMTPGAYRLLTRGQPVSDARA
jgi:AraC-like DNA-binding protein